MLEVLTDKASKGYKNKKETDTEQWKNTDNFAQLGRFHHDHQLQIYMYVLCM